MVATKRVIVNWTYKTYPDASKLDASEQCVSNLRSPLRQWPLDGGGPAALKASNYAQVSVAWGQCRLTAVPHANPHPFAGVPQTVFLGNSGRGGPLGKRHWPQKRRPWIYARVTAAKKGEPDSFNWGCKVLFPSLGFYCGDFLLRWLWIFKRLYLEGLCFRLRRNNW